MKKPNTQPLLLRTHGPLIHCQLPRGIPRGPGVVVPVLGLLAQLRVELPGELEGEPGPAGLGHLHSQPRDVFVLFVTLMTP